MVQHIFFLALFLGASLAPIHVAATDKNARPDEKFEDLVQRAERARTDGNLERTAKLYREAVRIRPKWVEGWGYLASSLYGLNRYAEARDAYRETTILTPKNGTSWAFLGLCEYELRNYRQAFDHLFKAEQLGLAADQDLTAQVKYHLAILWETAGQFELGLNEIAWFPQHNLGSEEIIEAIGLGVARRPWFPYEIPADMRKLVLTAGAAGFAENSHQPEKAAEYYKQLLTEYPKERDLHYAYGRFLVKIDPDGALKQYENEIEITPSHVPARVEAAFLCLKTGDLATALKYAQEAVALEPNNAAAHDLVGRALLDMDRPKDAILELLAATRIAPRNSTFHLQLAHAYRKAGETTSANKEMATFKQLEATRAAATQPGSSQMASH